MEHEKLKTIDQEKSRKLHELTYVTHSYPLEKILKNETKQNKKTTLGVQFNETFVAQGDARPKGAGQTGPEGSGGDSGELIQLVEGLDVLQMFYFFQINKLLSAIQLRSQQFAVIFAGVDIVVHDDAIFSFSVKGQGAADPSQLEKTFCTGLGNQSEKGRVARASVFVLRFTERSNSQQKCCLGD